MEGELSQLPQGFESRARAVPEEIAEHVAQIEIKREEIAELKTMESEPWPKQTELNEKLQRLASIVQALEEEAREDAAPNPGQSASAAQSSQAHAHQPVIRVQR